MADVSESDKQMYLHTTECGEGGHLSCRLYTQAQMDTALAEQRERDSQIAEAVNDSIKAVGKFAAAINREGTCLVPLSGGGVALQSEHVVDNLGICVYCATRSGKGEK